VEVDVARKRIGLSMKSDPFAQPEPAAKATAAPKSRKFKSKGTEKPKEKELTMEEKLAMLVNKFKK
jgi:protein Tex